MLKSLLAAASVVSLATLVGCAEPAMSEEEQGETTSHQTAGGDADAQANRVLDQLEAKVNACELLDDAEMKKLMTFEGKIHLTFEAYVSFKCSVREGEIVVGESSVETRAGWSSDDGDFTEQSWDTTASIEIPIKAVDVSGSVTSTVSVRQAGLTTTHNESVSASVAVSKDFGVASGSASVSIDGTGAVTISGGVSAPIPINVTDCTGEESVGVTVSLTASHVDTASAAVTQRATNLHVQYVRNTSAYFDSGYFTSGTAEARAQGKEICCNKENTCN
jgi:hypothetical protein